MTDEPREVQIARALLVASKCYEDLAGACQVTPHRLARAIIADHEAKQHKPDAAERAAVKWLRDENYAAQAQLATMFREEQAKDVELAEREGRCACLPCVAKSAASAHYQSRIRGKS